MQRTFLFLLILLPFQLFAQTPPKNVSLVGHLDYPQRLSDVWAYVDSAGREYAILGLEDGFAIIDLSDPTDPQQLQFIPGANTIWRDAIVYGHYAYGSNEGGGGVLIMDLSTLPGPVRYKDTVLNGVNTAHNI